MSVAYDLFTEAPHDREALQDYEALPDYEALHDYGRLAAPRLRLLAPVADPAPRRPARPAPRTADVVVLHAPRSVAPPVRLTRRGVVVLTLAVAALAVALLWSAVASGSGSAGAARPATAADSVTVGVGDTLWSIATRVAPGTDPRAEVDTLQRLNHLTGVALQPGQVLALH